MRKLKYREVNHCPTTESRSQDSKSGWPDRSAMVRPQNTSLKLFFQGSRSWKRDHHPLACEGMGSELPLLRSGTIPCLLTCWLRSAESLVGCVLNQMPAIIKITSIIMLLFMEGLCCAKRFTDTVSERMQIEQIPSLVISIWPFPWNPKAA